MAWTEPQRLYKGALHCTTATGCQPNCS